MSQKHRNLSEIPFLEAPYDINSHPDNVREYVRINHPEEDDVSIVVDMTFFMSRYGCTYGTCCSNRPHAGKPASGGCCTESVGLSRENAFPRVADKEDDDVERIDKLYDELDESIFANKKYADRKGVILDRKTDSPRLRTKNGVCIFSNPEPKKESDPPAGCAFHHLAMRKNVSHVETKPEVCWLVPLHCEYIEREDDKYDLLVTGMSRNEWGGNDDPIDYDQIVTEEDFATLKRRDYISWWCVDTPDAYNDNNPPLYISEEHELRRIMSDAGYEKLRDLAQSYERRTRMPGEMVNGGKPTIATMESLFSKVGKK